MQEMTSQWNAKQMSVEVKKEKAIQEANHHRLACKRSPICEIQNCSGKQGKPLHGQLCPPGDWWLPSSRRVTSSDSSQRQPPKKHLAQAASLTFSDRSGLYLCLNGCIKKRHQRSSHACLSLLELNPKTQTWSKQGKSVILWYIIYAKICLNLQ